MKLGRIDCTAEIVACEGPKRAYEWRASICGGVIRKVASRLLRSRVRFAARWLPQVLRLAQRRRSLRMTTHPSFWF